MATSETSKTLWDFPIKTDQSLDHNRPSRVVMEEMHHIYYVVDCACPFDLRIVKKEDDKMDEYEPPEYEITRL